MTEGAGGGAATRLRGLRALPAGWKVLRASGPAPFVTRAVLEDPSGQQLEWTSRRHRKHLGLRPVDARRARRAAGRRPTASSLWLGALFGVGSLCFLVASVPLYFTHVRPAVVAWTFAAGSVFFTAAAAVQYAQSARASDTLVPADDAARPRHLWFGRWRPRRIDWWASLIQLAGTIQFNVSTFIATQSDLSVQQSRRLVWGPDVGGSICFLVASWLAYAEANPGIRPRSDHSVGWRIAALNLAGSIAFGAAAVGARLIGETGEPANVALVNVGTGAGALCFLAGAVLLPVESAQDASVRAGTPATSAGTIPASG